MWGLIDNQTKWYCFVIYDFVLIAISNLIVLLYNDVEYKKIIPKRSYKLYKDFYLQIDCSVI